MNVKAATPQKSPQPAQNQSGPNFFRLTVYGVTAIIVVPYIGSVSWPRLILLLAISMGLAELIIRTPLTRWVNRFYQRRSESLRKHLDELRDALRR